MFVANTRFLTEELNVYHSLSGYLRATERASRRENGGDYSSPFEFIASPRGGGGGRGRGRAGCGKGADCRDVTGGAVTDRLPRVFTKAAAGPTHPALQGSVFQ